MLTQTKNFSFRNWMRSAWTASLFLYIVSGITFFAGPYSAIGSVCLYLFFCVSLLNIFSERRVRLNLFCLSLILYGIYIFISSLWTPTSHSDVAVYIYNYVTMALIVICVYNYIKEGKDFENILLFFMLGGLCLSIYVFSSYGMSLFENLRSTTKELRVGDNLANVNQIGTQTVFGALIAFYLLRYGKKTPFNIIAYSLCFIITLLISILTGSKKVFLMIVLGFFVLVAYNPKSRNSFAKKLINLVVASAIILLLIYLINNLSIFHTLKTRIDDFLITLTNKGGNETDNSRIYMAQMGIQVFLRNPFLGDGFLSSYSYFGTYSHNNYVEILMNTGIIGFILLYFPYIPILLGIIQNRKSMNPMYLVLSMIFFLILFAAVGYVYYYDRPTQILLCLVSAYFLNFHNKERRLRTNAAI